MDWESLVWNTDLPAMRKLVMLVIARKADASGLANISVTEISATATMARQSVYDQITVAIQRNQLERIAPSQFRISLIQPVAALYATRTEPASLSTPPVHDVRHPYTGISGPYMERTSETPSGFSPVISSVLSPSPVLENEELRQEGISITREGQGELISTDTPAWLTDLRTTPGYNLDAAHERRLIERVEAAAISTQRLCEAATSIAAKWESYKWSPTNKRGYKRLDLTFFDWAKREGLHHGKPSNGRYRAPGTFVPKGGTPEAYARWPAQTHDDA